MDNDQLVRAHTSAQASKRPKADLEEVPQCCIDEPISAFDDETKASLANHPASFSFPTLSPDGSVDNLSTSPSPAADPTSLTTRLNMAENDMSDSTSSLEDGSYEMVTYDDASDVSNDDHETASLASSEHNMSEDVVDVLEEPASTADEAEGTQPRSTGLTDHLTTDIFGNISEQELRAAAEAQELEEENDSFLSEDLETPRQSTLSPALVDELFRQTQLPSPPKSPASAAKAPSEGLRRVLFISNRTVPEAEKNAICVKLTSCLAGAHDTGRCRVTKLPETPSGISPINATTFGHGDVEINVKHCIGVDDKPGPEYHSRKFALHILDADEEFSSVYTVGGRRKPDFKSPDLAVIYLSNLQESSIWLSKADSAMHMLNVPVMVIYSPAVGKVHRGLRSDYLMNEFLQADHAVLQRKLKSMLGEGVVEATPEMSTSPKKAMKVKVRESNGPFAGLVQKMAFLLFVILPTIFGAWHMQFAVQDPIAQAEIRREALTSALTKVTNCTNVTKTFNAEHLVPLPTIVNKNFFGQQKYDMPYASYYQGAAPNHIVVSLTRRPGKVWYPTPKHVRVSKSGRDIPYNQTLLIDGIYDLTINPAEAHGLVDVNMLTKSPNMNFSMSYNFGNRMLQRQTYHKASTDISKSVTKDLTVARKAAQSFTEKLQLELTAGATATKNVTKQLALYAARDLQLFGNTASAKINDTLIGITKDVAKFQNELVALSKSMQKLMTSTGQVAKALPKKAIVDPLKLSRERAVGFRQKFFSRRKSSVTSSLSTVLGKGLVSKDTTTKKPCAHTQKKRMRARKAAEQELQKVVKAQQSAEKEAVKRREKLQKMEARLKERAMRAARD